MIERIIDELRDADDELTSIRVPWQDIAIDVAIRARLPIHVVADVFNAFDETYRARLREGALRFLSRGTYHE